MFQIIYSKQFERDVKKIQKQGKDLKKLKHIIVSLSEKKSLPIKNRNHKLKGNFEGYYECHIGPNWLLIYKKTATKINFIRTGSHSDLF